jgi:hypothetical protein
MVAFRWVYKHTLILPILANHKTPQMTPLKMNIDDAYVGIMFPKVANQKTDQMVPFKMIFKHT